MIIGKVIEAITNGVIDEKLSLLYTKEKIAFQKQRYIEAIKEFEKIFGEGKDLNIFSAPGRTEIGGNHTDHNHGRVLAASINLDVIAIVTQNDDNIIRLKSKGYEMDIVELSNLLPFDDEIGKSQALIRGICSRLKSEGYKLGGFDAYTTSNVLKGSGLSSSAAFEVLVSNIINIMFNNGEINPIIIAQASQYAENIYFGKPSGLMDQMACSVGGFVAIDFYDQNQPKIEKVEFDFNKYNHSLCIVDTGGNHADLTDEYTTIRSEMDSIAKALEKPYMREVNIAEFEENIPMLRKKLGDRAVLRALHFIGDNERVLKQTIALKEENFDEFLNLVTKSGYSSFMYNQNVFATKNTFEQGVSLALALTERFLKGKGAFRVHGGGFAGTILTFVPNELTQKYKTEIEKVFGLGSCHILSIRPIGGTKIV